MLEGMTISKRGQSFSLPMNLPECARPGRRNFRTVEAFGQSKSGLNIEHYCARGRAHSGSRAQRAQKVRGILS